MTFEEELLANIAATLGVPADLLGRDYEAQFTDEDRAYRRLVRRYEQEIEQERITMQGAIANAVFAIWIADLPLRDAAWIVLGYDPQKLLPSPEKARPLTTREWASLVFGDLYDRDTFSKLAWKPLDHLTDECISFTGRRPAGIDFTRLYPDVSRGRERTFEHKIAIVDLSGIEQRVIGHLIDDSRVRAIYLDFDGPQGEIPGHVSFDQMLHDAREQSRRDALFGSKPTISTAAGKRDMSYLDHDPTKRHKRRKRK